MDLTGLPPVLSLIDWMNLRKLNLEATTESSHTKPLRSCRKLGFHLWRQIVSVLISSEYAPYTVHAAGYSVTNTYTRHAFVKLSLRIARTVTSFSGCMLSCTQYKVQNIFSLGLLTNFHFLWTPIPMARSNFIHIGR